MLLSSLLLLCYAMTDQVGYADAAIIARVETLLAATLCRHEAVE